MGESMEEQFKVSFKTVSGYSTCLYCIHIYCIFIGPLEVVLLNVYKTIASHKI